jgi:hypothetical protein
MQCNISVNKVPDSLGSTQALIQWVAGLRWPKCDADHSPLSTVDINYNDMTNIGPNLLAYMPMYLLWSLPGVHQLLCFYRLCLYAEFPAPHLSAVVSYRLRPADKNDSDGLSAN